MQTSVDGGYALITVGQLANVCAARKDGRISFLALRTWLAAHEQRAKRCTAKGWFRYTTAELARLVRAPERSVCRAVRELTDCGLFTWTKRVIEFPSTVLDFAEDLAAELGTSPKRPVPIPRYLLRAVFRHTRPSEVMAAIAHLIRCLFRRGRELFNYGLIKASWVASVFGVGERSVHSARRWLIDQKFFTQEYVNQFVLNRWGARFVVSFKQVNQPQPVKRVRSKSAPPMIRICTSTKTSTSKYQENYKPADGGQNAGLQTGEISKPDLKRITPDDLRKISRLEVLYEQAVRAHWIEATEANFRNFVCAALRATRAGGRVGAIFAGIVKKRLWHHVTQEQEDRALAVLRRYREQRKVRPKAREGASDSVQPPAPIGEVCAAVLNCADGLKTGDREFPNGQT